MKNPKFRVGLIGAGWVGEKRARTISEHPDSELISVADIEITRAQHLATQFGSATCRVQGRTDSCRTDPVEKSL